MFSLKTILSKFGENVNAAPPIPGESKNRLTFFTILGILVKTPFFESGLVPGSLREP
jgi:hypothetical protein